MTASPSSGFIALLRKEWIAGARAIAITLRFIIALPIMQLFLFGYAINTDPKHLPTGLLSVEHSKYERTLVAALQQHAAITTSARSSSEAEAERALAAGRCSVRHRTFRRISTARSTAARRRRS